MQVHNPPSSEGGHDPGLAVPYPLMTKTTTVMTIMTSLTLVVGMFHLLVVSAVLADSPPQALAPHPPALAVLGLERTLTVTRLSTRPKQTMLAQR